jgi:hypothetical protein
VGRLVKVAILWFDLCVLLSFMWDVIQLILDDTADVAWLMRGCEGRGLGVFPSEFVATML